MNESDLDRLLSVPLDDVADAGFSAKLAARIEKRNWWRERVTLFAPVAAAAAIVPFLPLREFTDTALRVSPLLADSSALALAGAVLALTISLEQRFRDAQSAL